MSNAKVISIIDAGDDAVRAEGGLATDALRHRVQVLEAAAGQLITKTNRLEFNASDQLAMLQGRIAVLEAEVEEMNRQIAVVSGSLEAKKTPLQGH